MSNRQDLEVAVVLGAHGVQGQVRMKCFVQEPMEIAALGAAHDLNGNTWQIRPENFAKGILVAKLKGSEGALRFRDQAEALKGLKLFVPADSLPFADEDEFYPFELEGIEVRDTEGAAIGQVIKVKDYGAGDLLEIRFKLTGKAELFAFTKQAFPDINLEGGWLSFIRPDELNADPNADQEGS